MIKHFSVLLGIALFASSYTLNNKSQEIEAIDVAQLQAKISKPSNDTLYVINFFATWCRPCIEEMPHFVEVAKKQVGQKVKFIFVSLDGISDKAKVEAFAVRKNLPGEVYVLDAGDPNVWISQIHSSWSGSMPATMFYIKGEKKFFHEGDFDLNTLDSTIKAYK